MVRSVNPKREKKELGYFCIFLHLVFGRVFLPQLQLCTNLSKNRKIKQHCQVTLMRAFTHFIPTIKPTNERNSFRYVFSRVSNVSETNFRHAPAIQSLCISPIQPFYMFIYKLVVLSTNKIQIQPYRVVRGCHLGMVFLYT